MKWNRKRKVYKYYISQMVFVRREKNLDFRAGPDMIDVYERRDSECSKETYDKYPHEKVSCTSACYYRKEDTYTYCKYEGLVDVSPQESYDMVKSLLTIPIAKVKTTSKSNIDWAIKALDILIKDKRCDIVRIESEDYKYNETYIRDCVSKINEELSKLKEDKEKLENIYKCLANRKKVKEMEKQKEIELREKLLLDVKITCECGNTLSYTYNRCFCGECGKKVKDLWEITAKKLLKRNDKVSRFMGKI